MGSGDEFLNQIVTGWLKRQDNVLKHTGEPTWHVLVDILEKLGHKEIATDIRRRDDGPQHRSASEQQQDGNRLAALSTNSSDSLMVNPQSHSPYCSDQTTTPISIQPVSQSKQVEPHTR